VRCLHTVTTNCKHIRCLVIGFPVDCASDTVCYTQIWICERTEFDPTWGFYLRMIRSAYCHGCLRFHHFVENARRRRTSFKPYRGSFTGRWKHHSCWGSSYFSDTLPRTAEVLRLFECQRLTHRFDFQILQPHFACPIWPKRIVLLGSIDTYTSIKEYYSDHVVCPNHTDVSDSDFDFISQNCCSLECVHLHISFPDFQILSPDYIGPELHSLPIQDFPYVALQLYLTEDLANYRAFGKSLCT
jgi:hypothetical protein